jgi:phosphatidylglycerol lysyltransferase
MVGTLVMVLFFASAKLLRPTPAEITLPNPEELARANTIIAKYPYTYAHLALLRDKSLLFNSSATAFIMYGIEGRSWVAMGDPVGPYEERRELAWKFREMGEYHDGWTVFYQVRPENLDIYLELGLNLLKIGEEARVRLAEFSLTGKKHKSLRGSVNRIEKQGCHFEIIQPESVPALLPQLKTVSDSWLASKNTREKGFSLGFFKEAYLVGCPIATVRQNETVVAFANLWLGDEKEELSLDLMRYLGDAPHGIMDYLFTKLMLWGKEQGYVWFNLGMAPLAGLQSRSLAPTWNRFGAMVFGYGERFYNFQGVHQFKDKFNPLWEPRYLAVPDGIALPRILANLSALIAGGLKGVIHK